jgi:hypothetical protein
MLRTRRDEENAFKTAQARQRAARETDLARQREEKLRQKALVRRDKERAHRSRWRHKHRQQMVTAIRTRLRRLVNGDA